MPESVYISSTFEDLKNFREAAIKCIRSLKDYYTPVAMEYYDAEDIHFVNKCQSDVEACNIYILILGKRYGYIPHGFKKSITELEYERAMACKEKGKPIEILVFKVGDLCNTYKYKENDPRFAEYTDDFLTEVKERLSPKPFDSEAELALQLSYALMKRLFRLIRTGEKIILPDKDAVLCYCDRKVPITSLKLNVLLKKKKIFFLQGNRITDYPGGVVKRFAKYSLGSFNKIEPLIKITDMMTSCDPENSFATAFYNILEYTNRPPSEENVQVKGFVEELGLLKSNKVILPFYYDFNFDEDSKKFTDFFDFLHLLFNEYSKKEREYELFAIILIYSQQPDYDTIKMQLGKYELLNTLGTTIDKLTTVPGNDILDWLEAFITSMEHSASIYKEYFDADEDKQYNMQDINRKLSDIIDDLGAGNEKIKKFL
jgi:Domain of unknown function (DUF4062)